MQYERNKHNYSNLCLYVCVAVVAQMGPAGLLCPPNVYIRTSNKCFCNDMETLNMFKCRYVECLDGHLLLA